MSELIFNIYLFFDNEVCSEVGRVGYAHSGTDDEGLALLQREMPNDVSKANRVKLTTPFTRAEHVAACRLGVAQALFDEVFAGETTPAAPLMVVTPVKDGLPHYNYSGPIGHLDVQDVSRQRGEPGLMRDWLVDYTSEAGIDLPRLIHDDYFVAIKLTFNQGKYVSAMKLLLSCIDSISYLEYGDASKNPFVAWLDTFADLAPLAITSSELWELRNGLLHMTNIDSSKVRKNKVRRISFQVSAHKATIRDASSEVHYFDFFGLIKVFQAGLGRWIETYNIDRSKFLAFVERYDATLSDARMAYTSSC